MLIKTSKELIAKVTLKVKEQIAERLLKAAEKDLLLEAEQILKSSTQVSTIEEKGQALVDSLSENLMVTNDMKLSEVQLSEVAHAGKWFTLSLKAKRVEVFDPNHPEANPKGWLVNITNYKGELLLGIDDTKTAESYREQLNAWKKAKTSLQVIVSVEHQGSVIYDPITNIKVGVSLNDKYLGN